MTKGLSFQAAGPSDRAMLIELQRRASLSNGIDRDWVLANPDIIDIPVEQLTPATAVIAMRDGVAAGFAIVLPRPDGEAELDGLFVEPALFRSGIGTALIAEAEKLAVLMGATTLRVVANTEALGFYRTVGFEQYDTVPTLLRPAPAMRKQLG